MKPAVYFPVEEGPLRMRAGLQKLGSDLGAGPSDRLYFQIDDELPEYLRAKREAPRRGSRAPLRGRHRWIEDPSHPEILAWMRATLAREHPARFDASGLRGPGVLEAGGSEPLSDFDALLACVQEDAAVVRRLPDGSDVATLLHVCFPSRWVPEALLGVSFRSIHRPVPGFAETDAFASSMLQAMIERGPFVRFVWTLCADDALDHHPEQGTHTPWPEAERGWLRVERQVTVGFPRLDAALFLIRTYRYAFESLGAQRRARLARAVDAMPESVSRYKGIAGHEIRIRELLDAAAAADVR